MLFRDIVVIFILLKTMLTANLPLLPSNDSGLLLNPPLPQNGNPSLSSNSTLANKILKIACNAQRYGKNPKVTSCRQIFGYIRHDETLLAYADRARGGGAHDVPLPIRTYSSNRIDP